jgi:hypothetical protein
LLYIDGDIEVEDEDIEWNVLFVMMQQIPGFCRQKRIRD